ncbi:hypothetical protein Droror1_Dr00020907 [Drosera rotundifolia]
MSCRGCGREGHNKRGCRHKDEWDAYAVALVADKIASAEKKAARTKENASKRAARAKKVAMAKENAAKENAVRTQQVNNDTASLDYAASLGSVFLSTFDKSQITDHFHFK